MLKLYFTFCCFFVLGISSYSQDRIYYKENKTDDWKVTAVTPDFIKGADPKKPQIAYSTALSKVLFIFNDRGNFLVIPKLFEKTGSDILIRNFYKKVDNKFNSFDKIITVENNIIICTYGKEVNKKIEYTVSNKPSEISKSDIAIIIFKNGEHKLIAGIDKAYKVLNEVQDMYSGLASSVDRPDSSQILKNKLLAQNDSPKNTDTSAKQSNISTNKIGGRQNGSAGNSAVTNLPASGSGTDVVNPVKEEKKLDSATLLNLQNKAMQNIKQLESYIKIISNKNTEADRVSGSIEQAMALFVNENARVEVSSATTGNIQPYKIKMYLNRLSVLNYDKVDIEWYNVQYTSQLRKGVDGNYYGVIEFEQRFTGMSNDKKVYQDITRKTVEVVLKLYKRNSSGVSTLEWDVFLGNIGITETKPA